MTFDAAPGAWERGFRNAVVCLLFGCTVMSADGQEFDGPLRVDASGRYLETASGEPFYYVADTPWQLLASLDLDATREFIEIRRGQGFTALQLVATPWSFDDTAANWDFEGEVGQARVNAAGDAPFAFRADHHHGTQNVDFERPVETYWRHVDAVLDLMADAGMLAYLIPLWASNFSADVTVDDHYVIGRFVGARYRDRNNVIWALGGDERDVDVAKYRAMAQGLHESHITQLVTMHPRSGRSSSDHLSVELDFHSIQARGGVAEMLAFVRDDYADVVVKPTFLCETWYEHDREGGVFGIHRIGGSPAFREHYWAARLAGGFGEGYGAWTIWLNLSTWHQDIHRPGAIEIAGAMRSILATIAWYELTPGSTIVAASAGIHRASTNSGVTIAYLERGHQTLEIASLGRGYTMTIFDPATGSVVATRELGASAKSRSWPIDAPNEDAVVILRPVTE